MIRLQKLLFLFLALIITIGLLSDTAHKLWKIATLNVVWGHDSASFVLSKEHDSFDVTFKEYPQDQLTTAPEYEDLVPPVLHHIALGRPDWNATWGTAVQSCLDMHPRWESYIWTTETAAKLVEERFPQLKPTWDGYRYDIERVDALRYMVLYEFGGVVLDMDLQCRRALGPLRRFEFVAPAAHPTGFSIGFMMAQKGSVFMQAILNSLPGYNKVWLGVPYAAVMFSTGCHFASVIHANLGYRHRLKILPGPMHSLSGHVVTPLFEHMGSSSWHGSDVKMLKSIRTKHILVVFYIVAWVLIIYKFARTQKRLAGTMRFFSRKAWQ